MRITVKLSPQLAGATPGTPQTSSDVTTSPDITLSELIKRLRLKTDSDTLLVVVDDTNVPPGERDRFSLRDGQVVNILPPLQGG